MRTVLATVSGGLFAFALACSSVPDVVYSDDAGGASGSSSSGTSGEDAGEKPHEEYRCPDKPPPDGRGLCCGDMLCLNCSASQCDRCAQRACGASTPCCAKNAGAVECRAQAQCTSTQ